jgi:hypothetical protein
VWRVILSKIMIYDRVYNALVSIHFMIASVVSSEKLVTFLGFDLENDSSV